MKRVFAVILGIVLIVVLVGLAVGGFFLLRTGAVGPGGMMGAYGVRGLGFRFGLPIFSGLTCLFWLLVIGGVIWLITTVAGGNKATAPGDSSTVAVTTPTATTPETPLDVLRMRYAKGEITKEQFDEMKHNLES